ncbi:Uncharacterised protein [Escherichia coli]|nr:Uncharacterised protein [Escherichia coli]
MRWLVGELPDLQLDHEITETTRSLGSKSNTQILGLTCDTQIKGIGGKKYRFSYVSSESGIPPLIVIVIMHSGNN